ncbi:NAD(+)/NADH kinase [Kamptonema cortianum]|nr:NAD(+)/NADH kinase [Geitlerinema splendidum]MDK3155951.1 NAD(+)/NADH kinase [Kamptonema cortianum]
MRVHTLVNLFRPDAVQAAEEAVAMLRAKNIEVGSDRDAATALDIEAIPADSLAHADLMVTFGGDGTLLRASHLCSERGTPILGVYYGRFGFVTQCQPTEVKAALTQFLDGDSVIEDRMMVQTELIREGRVVATLHSLNEAVVQRSATTRVMTFEVRVDGTLMSRYPADGIMVCTPTGSTAYNLSAGGPIVDPMVRAMLITAIMPHTLSARPLVLRDDAVVEIGIQTRGDAVLSCDGQSRLHLLSGDKVRITRSPRVTRLLVVDRSDFLNKLAERFQWSKGPRHA